MAQKYWSGIIDAVQTPLGFFSLIVLVIEAILGSLIGLNAVSESNQTFLLIAMVSIIILLIVIVSTIAWKKPEALWGERYEFLTKYFAESLAKDVVEGFDGYLRNDQAVREEAYEFTQEVIKSSSYASDNKTQEFVGVFVDTMIKKSELRGRQVPTIKGVIEEETEL
ncbi:hypothetical protein NC796_25555 [Aliifodinibius sp. S!AR15-10]|uniref:hypothetical protein n=1 Tax=Aliifodinibius sp. S!AR15-10 TaxID=2950437 RepID=UPI0028588622|nr:hypothetical protein [Aliifodinibius sp. S!AR15-10]MDR8394537.1 hypothetical protein [Aliifodinibius sp. S!AR15-10]